MSATLPPTKSQISCTQNKRGFAGGKAVLFTFYLIDLYLLLCTGKYKKFFCCRQMHSGDKDRGWLEMESPSKLDGIMQDVLQRQKEEFLYSCSQCTCTMPNRRHYVMHMLTTHTTFSQTTRSRHLCHLCQFQTNDQNDMKKHIEFEHTQKGNAVTLSGLEGLKLI